VQPRLDRSNDLACARIGAQNCNSFSHVGPRGSTAQYLQQTQLKLPALLGCELTRSRSVDRREEEFRCCRLVRGGHGERGGLSPNGATNEDERRNRNPNSRDGPQRGCIRG
jgi:hypothetical protein